jgi:hypothetical membrane protein
MILKIVNILLFIAGCIFVLIGVFSNTEGVHLLGGFCFFLIFAFTDLFADKG